MDDREGPVKAVPLRGFFPMNMQSRLRRLEQRLEQLSAAERPSYACIDKHGRILDDGTAKVKPWVGRHYSELPPGPLKIYIGTAMFAV
jgi:hypothetical protein